MSDLFPLVAAKPSPIPAFVEPEWRKPDGWLCNCPIGLTHPETVATKDYVDDALALKEDIFTVGSGLHLENGVLSADSTEYVAGDRITIVDGVISTPIGANETANSNLSLDRTTAQARIAVDGTGTGLYMSPSFKRPFVVGGTYESVGAYPIESHGGYWGWVWRINSAETRKITFDHEELYVTRLSGYENLKNSGLECSIKDALLAATTVDLADGRPMYKLDQPIVIPRSRLGTDHIYSSSDRHPQFDAVEFSAPFVEKFELAAWAPSSGGPKVWYSVGGVVKQYNVSNYVLRFTPDMAVGVIGTQNETVGYNTYRFTMIGDVSVEAFTADTEDDWSDIANAEWVRLEVGFFPQRFYNLSPPRVTPGSDGTLPTKGSVGYVSTYEMYFVGEIPIVHKVNTQG